MIVYPEDLRGKGFMNALFVFMRDRLPEGSTMILEDATHTGLFFEELIRMTDSEFEVFLEKNSHLKALYHFFKKSIILPLQMQSKQEILDELSCLLFGKQDASLIYNLIAFKVYSSQLNFFWNNKFPQTKLQLQYYYQDYCDLVCIVQEALNAYKNSYSKEDGLSNVVLLENYLSICKDRILKMQ